VLICAGTGQFKIMERAPLGITDDDMIGPWSDGFRNRVTVIPIPDKELKVKEVPVRAFAKVQRGKFNSS
jgi:hypothetical protein